MSFSIVPILGVRLHLHRMWLVGFGLLAAGIYFVGVPGEPALSSSLELVLGLVAALVMIASYAVHELTHSIVAHRLQLPVSELNLFALADPSAPPVELPNGRVETVVAASGVLVSALLAVVIGAIWLSIPAGPDQGSLLLSGLAWWAAIGNIALTVINSAPSYPYDGGRVIRGVLWWLTANKLRATRLASRIGRGFAIALMFAGAIWAFITGDLVNPAWLFVAGLFLLQSSRRQVRRLEIQQALEGLTVDDVMEANVAVVGPTITLDTLYDQHQRSGDVETYPVTDHGLLLGSVDMRQVERVPRARWPRTRVADVMTGLERLQTMTRRESLINALPRFDGTRVDAIPVVDDEGTRLAGLVTRQRLIEKLIPRMERLNEASASLKARP